MTFNLFSLTLLFPKETTQHFQGTFSLTVFFDSKSIIERKTKSAHLTSDHMPAVHSTVGNILGMSNHSLFTNARTELEENNSTILDPTTQRITSCDKCI